MSGIPRIAIRVKEAAESLGCSTDHIRDLLDAGEIKSSKSGHLRLVDYPSLVAYFERNRVI